MTTAFYTHPICMGHDPGTGHPESPDRLRAVVAALEAPDFAGLDRREAPLAERAQLELAHSPGHVERVLEAVPATGHHAVDPDTSLSPSSGEAALRAAGALIAAVEAVAAGEVANAFCAVRPPGHHAERSQSMGFCLFNNVAIGAFHAQAAHGMDRVAVVDFDVHHGNGTEAMFLNAPDTFFASSHQWPAYPGTGRESLGPTIINVPLAPGTGSDAFRRGWDEIILPALDDFGPDMILVSAGFDAHARDPLCQLELATEDFTWISERLVERADGLCGGRLVSTLEGGYDLKALADSAAVHVRALMAAP